MTPSRIDFGQLFATEHKVYCLITEKDYKKFLKDSYQESLEIVQEDYIIRRRMNIDKGFFSALLKLNQETINRYLKEKLVLIKKESNV